RDRGCQPVGARADDDRIDLSRHCFRSSKKASPIRRRQTRETREENLRSVCGFKSGNSRTLLSRAAREIKQGRPARLCAISDRPPLWFSRKPMLEKAGTGYREHP